MWSVQGGVGPDLVLEISACGHRVCSDCLRRRLLLKEATQFTCPMGGCRGDIAESLMRQVLSSDELDQVQEKAMKAFLGRLLVDLRHLSPL